MNKDAITVTTIINAPIEMVWDKYTRPGHIVNWNFASDDWHCPGATCDLRPNGEFSFRMASKDGAHEFDLKGTYHDIKPQEFISYALEDNRQVQVKFENISDGVLVEQTFEPESLNSHDMQRAGWQAILDNFKKYVELN